MGCETLNILIVTGIYPPDIGGPANFSPEFGDFLRLNGHKVEILTLSDKAIKSTLEPTVHRVLRSGRFRRRLQVVNLIIKLGNKSDVIIATGLYEEVGIASLFLSKRLVMRIVGDPVWERATNNLQTSAPISEFTENSLSLKAQRNLLTWSINRGDLVVTPSGQLHDLLHRWGVSIEVVVRPNGVRIPAKQVKFDSYRAISVSRLVKWKNVDLTLACADACQLPISVVGSGPLESELKEKFQSQRIRFIGQKNRSEVDQMMAESNIFFLLSEYEGQSFALTEALANGMFCVVSNTEGNIQIISHLENGFIFDLSDAKKSLVELSNVLKTPQVVSQIGSNAREFAKKNLDSVVTYKNIMKLLESR